MIFGIHPVTLALTSSHRKHLHKLYLNKKFRHEDNKISSCIKDLADRRGISELEYVHPRELTYLSGNRPHQGVCLDSSPREVPILNKEDIKSEIDIDKSLLWIFPYNVLVRISKIEYML